MRADSNFAKTCILPVVSVVVVVVVFVPKVSKNTLHVYRVSCYTKVYGSSSHNISYKIRILFYFDSFVDLTIQ